MNRFQVFYRNAGIWGVYFHWRKNGYRHLHHPQVFYLYLFSYDGLTGGYLLFCSLLDECEAVHSECPAQPAAVFVTAFLPEKSNHPSTLSNDSPPYSSYRL